MSLALFMLLRKKQPKKKPAPTEARTVPVAVQSVEAARADAVAELHRRHAEECPHLARDLDGLHGYFDVQSKRAAKGLPLGKLRPDPEDADPEDADQEEPEAPASPQEPPKGEAAPLPPGWPPIAPPRPGE